MTTKLPIIRWSAKDALKWVNERGYKVVPVVKGHAEIWSDRSECVGFLTKRSLRKYNETRTDTG